MNNTALKLRDQVIPEATPLAQTTPRSHWVVSPLVDAFTLLSGFSICAIFLCFRPFGLDIRVALALFAVDRYLAMMHSWSTTYLVVGSKIFEPMRKKNPDRYLKIPLLIFLVSLLLGVLIAKLVNISDDPVVDSNSFLYYVPYVAVFWIGHFWHFGRQDFGVLSLYRQRAGQSDSSDRNIDNRYTQIMMYVIQPIIYFKAFSHSPFTVLVNWLSGIQSIIDPLASVAFGAALILSLGVFVLELRKQSRSLGKLIYYAVMFGHPAFLYSTDGSAFIYWHVAYIWSHWIIASFLSAKVHSTFLVGQGKRFWPSLLKHMSVVLGVSILLLWIFSPFAGLSLIRADFVDAREILASLPPDRFFITGIYFGFGLGEQLVHYYCDRCLFRFKDPDVRQAVGPYL